MKIQRIVSGFAVLLAIEAGAQVPNDDCANALVLNPPMGTGQCDFWGAAGFSLPLTDSTDNAMVDLPFPMTPLNCDGYPGYALAPAKDLWYKAYGQWGYGWSIESSDTCHLSVWAGGGCANLLPLFCYASSDGTIAQPSPSYCNFHPTDTIYLQVSNKNAFSSDARFRLCFTSACGPEMGASFNFSASTPVRCVVNEVVSVPSSDLSGANGEVHVAVLQGTPPYTIIWNDGSTAFDRSGLMAGTYWFILEDGEGCVQSDTVVVGSQLHTGMNSIAADHQHVAFEATLSGSAGPYQVSFGGSGDAEVALIDMQGRIVGSGILRSGSLVFPQVPATVGPYGIVSSGTFLPRWLGYLFVTY